MPYNDVKMFPLFCLRETAEPATLICTETPEQLVALVLLKKYCKGVLDLLKLHCLGVITEAADTSAGFGDLLAAAVTVDTIISHSIISKGAF